MNNEDEINIFDCLIVLAKHKKLIIITTLFFALFAIGYSLIKPPIYTAKTVLLPPITNKSNIQQMLNDMPGFKLGGLNNKSQGLNTPGALTAILNTRSVSAAINKKIKTMEKYRDIKKLGNLAKNIKIQTNKKVISPLVTLYVKNKDPELAADIANIAVKALNNRLQQIAITTASQKKFFYEKQLEEAKENLIEAEQEMMKFQEKTGVLAIETFTGISHNRISNLNTRISANESAEYIRKFRNIKFYENIFKLILGQYESAKLDESETPPSIQVLEKAIPPSRGTRQISKKLVIITLAAFLMSVFAAFILEFIEKQLAIKENKGKLQILKEHLTFKKKV